MSPKLNVLVLHSSPAPGTRVAAALQRGQGGKYGSAIVHTASTLEQAIEVIERAVPDVIVTGTALSDAEGPALIAALRARAPGVPIVLVVGDPRQWVASRALVAGAQGHFSLGETRNEVIELAVRQAVESAAGHNQERDAGGVAIEEETMLEIRHQINNPLASLLLNVGLLKEATDEDRDELIGEIENAARRLASIVNDLGSGGGEGPGAGASAAAASQRATTPRTILVADDEDSVRAVIVKILTRAGHTVLEAQHGAEALRIAEAYTGDIDLLITDMYMPGLRGSEVLEQLRPLRPGLRVLFVSGYSDEDLSRWGVGPGVGFLRKPFTVEELSESVENAFAPRGEGAA